jgi:outer membrane protein OmpA-like peptidoglycan-associated protein
MAKPIRRAWIVAALIAISSGAGAQTGTPPKPIPAPPIPAPPLLGPAPPVTLGKIIPPARPVLSIPDAPDLVPVAIPPPAEMIAADPTDKTPPPPSGALTGPTAMVSPGAADSQIEEIGFTIDPGSARLSQAADAKLRDVAKSLSQSPAARLEVRVFSPSKQANSQSAARRLSLSRYLAIRDVLLHAGVAANRIDGRPLASEPNELNPDRVELYIEH